MDLTRTIEPDSTQVNADDLISGPVVVTITDVTKGSAEQPVDIHLAEFPDRVYRPSKSMRRVLVGAWGKEAAEYVGRSMRLYRDPDVTFGREKVGGIKISHLSHIDKRLSLALTVSRGKRSPHIVEPLTETPPAKASKPSGPSAADVAKSTDLDELRSWWKAATPDVQAVIRARVDELNNAKEADPDPWPDVAASVAARDATLDGE